MNRAPARVLFSSHDGYGLGHVRRNSRLASALRGRLPDAELTVVTGVASQHAWLGADGVTVERVPPLVKDSRGRYRNVTLTLDEALAERARRFEEVVERTRPDLVVVDRHPFGLHDELRSGLELARRNDAAVVLGLRDILDAPKTVRREVAGSGWRDVPDLVDEILVYGDRVICDHERDYRLPLPPTYCGIVVDHPRRTADATTDPATLVVSAGGGADGQAVARLAKKLSARTGFAHTVLVRGPAARTGGPDADTGRLRIQTTPDDCGRIFAAAAASVQMAGYNSTYEAIAAGIRPVLVPRRAPRREQAIRATRLAAMGLADVVDEGASLSEVIWLLERPRRLPEGAAQEAGLSLDGASVAIEQLCRHVGRAVRSAA